MSESRKKILIVGGATGIGRKIVENLSRLGHALTVTSRKPSAIETDTNTEVQMFDAVDPLQTLEIPDSLDACIYLPGTITLMPFHRLKREDFVHDMEVNFHGAVRALQQALPSLKRTRFESASVILFSSVAATTGMPFHASVGAAKAAVEALGRSLAAELAPKIRVNVVAPSLTDTPLASSLLADEKRVEASARRHPLNRIGDPAEVAALVEFLVSDSSNFMTGQVIGIDGGLSSIRQL